MWYWIIFKITPHLTYKSLDIRWEIFTWYKIVVSEVSISKPIKNFTPDTKNPAYGRHWFSRPMWIVAPIPKFQIFHSYAFLRTLSPFLYFLVFWTLFDTFCIFFNHLSHVTGRYLLDLYVPLEPLGASWTFRYLLDLYVHLGPLGTSWTLRYLLDI